MVAPIILVAAIVCTITHPAVVQLADGIIPNNSEFELIYIPMTAIDIGCAIFSHTPFSFKEIKDIAPHAFKGLRAFIRYTKPITEARNPIRGSNKWMQNGLHYPLLYERQNTIIWTNR
jgi:hypothetical protein